ADDLPGLVRIDSGLLCDLNESGVLHVSGVPSTAAACGRCTGFRSLWESLEQGSLCCAYRFGNRRWSRIDCRCLGVSPLTSPVGSGIGPRGSPSSGQHSCNVEILRSNRPGICRIAFARAASGFCAAARTLDGSTLVSSLATHCRVDTRHYFRCFPVCRSHRAGAFWPFHVVANSCRADKARDAAWRSGNDLWRPGIWLIANLLPPTPGVAREGTQYFAAVGLEISRCTSCFSYR